MLIDTITFEYKGEQFVVPNNELNFALIAADRFTRQIKMTKTFSFQAAKEMKAPKFFIETLVKEYLNEVTTIEEAESFGVDEMVGTY